MMQNWINQLMISMIMVLLVACANQQNNQSIYKVRAGDSLSLIAKKHHTTVDALIKSNRIKSANHIYVGQQLLIPNQITNNTIVQRINKPQKFSTKAKSTPKKKSPASTPTIINQQIAKIAWKKPTNGNIIRHYQPNLPGQKGVLYDGNEGQNIYSAASGVVAYARPASGYGQVIIIKHTPTIYSTYGHLGQIMVREGTPVKPQQLLGKMGQKTAQQQGLYFEIRQNGNTVNPTLYIQ